MKKVKVGFLPFYLKLYDDVNPNGRLPLIEYMKSLIAGLEQQGLEVVTTDDLCRIKEEFDAAAEKFNASDVDAVITYHVAYSPSLESIDALLSLQAPIVVMDTTPDHCLAQAADHSNRITPNHGIHGVQDMCNLLKRNGRGYQICVGHAKDGVVAETAALCRAAAAAKAFRNARIGSAGGSFAGMGDFKVSDEYYKASIGAEVVYMTPDVAETYLAKVTESEIDAEMASDAEKFTIEVENMDNYRMATKAGLALRKWMDAENMLGCTVNFLTLESCGLPKMPFVECCKVMERGLGYAGEGDVLTAGLVGALRSVHEKTAFTEMFCPDWEQDLILMSHMGESNPNLSQWKPVIHDKPFNYNSTGDTVAMSTCQMAGNVVIANLAPMAEGYALILCPGQTLNLGLEFGVYRQANQGWFKPSKPLKQFLKEYSQAGGTHHSAIVYDASVEELAAFGKMMGFEVVVI